MNRTLIAATVGFACFSVAIASTLPPRPDHLPITTIVIDAANGPARFETELASDSASQEKGLMFRTKMAANAGMLFDFHKPDFQVFWMKNTVLPLDMIFIRADGTISSIAPNTTPYSETPIPSTERVRAVLEINGGRSAQLGIEPGQHVHNLIFGNALPRQK